MTTAVGAYNVIKSRIETAAITFNSVLLPLRWQGETDAPIPDEPAPFAFIEFITDPGELVSFGGGRGNNRYRNPARVDCWVFIPKGWGVIYALEIAELFAVLFRSYRDVDISCFAATTHAGGANQAARPPGLDSEVNNYAWALCEVDLFYDQIG